MWAVGENENASRIAEREMKTVLKDVKTGLLFRNMDEWTSDLEQAASFRDTLTALKFCQRNNLDGGGDRARVWRGQGSKGRGILSQNDPSRDDC